VGGSRYWKCTTGLAGAAATCLVARLAVRPEGTGDSRPIRSTCRVKRVCHKEKAVHRGPLLVADKGGLCVEMVDWTCTPKGGPDGYRLLQ
jgi:hypothetical protein